MRNVIITGGARGIGRCITEHFAIEGDRVFVIDKDMPAVPVENVVYYHGDIADKTVLEDFYKFVLKSVSGIDVIVNNALPITIAQVYAVVMRNTHTFTKRLL